MYLGTLLGRAFSINAEMKVENLKVDNLVALRMVFSELQSTLDLVEYSTAALTSKALLGGETMLSSASR